MRLIDPNLKDLLKSTKDSDGKLYYEINWDFVTLIAERMAANKQNGKYERFGWLEKGTPIDEIKQALLRHTLEIMKHNFKDDNQELGHISAAACNLMFLYTELIKLK